MRLVIILFLALVILCTACQPKQVSELATLTGSPPTTEVLAADDVVITPGGPAYRANIQQQGVSNPFLPVQTVVVTLTGVEDLRLDYRANVDTKAGQTRNNILFLYGTSIPAQQGGAVVFTPQNLPSGVEAEPAQTSISPMTKAVMQIHIASGLKSGKYSFQILVEINGKDYGQVPCTINVTD